MLLFQKSLQIVYKLILDDNILAGHDISGGLITTLLEMCFADTNLIWNKNNVWKKMI
jgi:phosphoribosylformylglycinamidine synthase